MSLVYFRLFVGCFLSKVIIHILLIILLFGSSLVLSCSALLYISMSMGWSGRVHSGWPVIFGGRFYSGLIALTNSKCEISTNNSEGSGSSLLALKQVYRLQQDRSEQIYTTSHQFRDIYLILRPLLAIERPIICLMMTFMAEEHPDYLHPHTIHTTWTGLARSRDPSLPSLIGSIYRSSEYLQGRRKHLKMIRKHFRIIYNHDRRYSASLNPLWRSM